MSTFALHSPPCLHCRTNGASKASNGRLNGRGLCRRCWRDRAVREKYPTAGKGLGGGTARTWTEDEYARLAALHRAGTPMGQIAVTLGRSANACKARLALGADDPLPSDPRRRERIDPPGTTPAHTRLLHRLATDGPLDVRRARLNGDSDDLLTVLAGGEHPWFEHDYDRLRLSATGWTEVRERRTA